jgi:hypothetical protein
MYYIYIYNYIQMGWYVLTCCWRISVGVSSLPSIPVMRYPQIQRVPMQAQTASLPIHVLTVLSQMFCMCRICHWYVWIFTMYTRESVYYTYSIRVIDTYFLKPSEIETNTNLFISNMINHTCPCLFMFVILLKELQQMFD